MQQKPLAWTSKLHRGRAQPSSFPLDAQEARGRPFITHSVATNQTRSDGGWGIRSSGGCTKRDAFGRDGATPAGQPLRRT